MAISKKMIATISSLEEINIVKQSTLSKRQRKLTKLCQIAKTVSTVESASGVKNVWTA